jgi:PAS domain S-box-containing protein
MQSFVLQRIIHPKSLREGESGVIGAEEAAQGAGGKSMLGNLLAVAMEKAPMALAMFDHEMRYLLANQRWIQEFQLQDQLPLAGRSQYDLFPTLHEGWRKMYEKALQGNEMWAESQARPDNGPSLVVTRCDVVPWRSAEDGRVAGVLVAYSKVAVKPAAAAESEKVETEGEVEAESSADGPSDEVNLEATPSDAMPEVSESAGLEVNEQAPVREADGMAGGEPEDGAAVSSGASGDCFEREEEVPIGDLGVPVFVLDREGRIARANPLAAGLCLARGLEEGKTPLWNALCGDQESETLLREQFLQWAGEGESAPPRMVTVRTRAETCADGVVCPGRWLLAAYGSDGRLVSAVGLTGMSPFDLAPKVAIPLSPPPAQLRLEAELAEARLRVTRLEQQARTMREAEQTLLKRDRQQRGVLDAIPGGILILDEHGLPVFQNSHLRQMLGRDLEEGGNVEDWLAGSCPDAAHAEEVRRLWREYVWRKEVARIFSLRTAGNVVKEIELRPVALPQGGVLVFFQEVEGLCRAQEQLLAHQGKFRALFQENPVAVLLSDRGGMICDANAAAEWLTGVSRSELRRMEVSDIFTPRSASARKEALKDLARSGGGKQCLPVSLADGERVMLTVALVRAAQGGAVQTLNFLEPMQARQEMESGETPGAGEGAGGQESSKTAASLQEDAAAEPAPPQVPVRILRPPVLLARTRVNGRICEWTAEAVGWFGLGVEEMRGRGLHELFQPSDPSGFYGCVLPAALAAAGAVDWVCRRGSRTGQVLGVLVERDDPGGAAARLLIPGFEEVVMQPPAVEPKDGGELVEAERGVTDPDAGRARLEDAHQRIQHAFAHPFQFVECAVKHGAGRGCPGGAAVHSAEAAGAGGAA